MSKFVVIIPGVINLISFIYVLLSFIIPMLNTSLTEITLWIIIEILLFWFIWLPITVFATLFSISMIMD